MKNKPPTQKEDLRAIGWFVGINGDKVERFLGVLKLCGLDVVRAPTSPPPQEPAT